MRFLFEGKLADGCAEKWLRDDGVAMVEGEHLLARSYDLVEGFNHRCRTFDLKAHLTADWEGLGRILVRLTPSPTRFRLKWLSVRRCLGLFQSGRNSRQDLADRHDTDILRSALFPVKGGCHFLGWPANSGLTSPPLV